MGDLLELAYLELHVVEGVQLHELGALTNNCFFVVVLSILAQQGRLNFVVTHCSASCPSVVDGFAAVTPYVFYFPPPLGLDFLLQYGHDPLLEDVVEVDVV